MLLLAALFVAACTGCWLLLLPQPNTNGDSSGANTTQVVPQGAEVDVLVAGLREGNEDVEARRRVDSPGGGEVTTTEGVLRGLGPLLPSELEEMRGTLAQLEQDRAKRLRDAQSSFEGSGDVLKQIEFARRLCNAEEASAAMSALEQGSYFLRERDDGVPTIDGIRYVGTSVVRDGRELFVSVVIETKKFQRLDSALAYLAESERVARVLAMEEFNGMPSMKRKALVQTWNAASDVSRSHDPTLVKYFRPGLVITQQDTLVEK